MRITCWQSHHVHPVTANNLKTWLAITCWQSHHVYHATADNVKTCWLSLADSHTMCIQSLQSMLKPKRLAFSVVLNDTMSCLCTTDITIVILCFLTWKRNNSRYKWKILFFKWCFRTSKNSYQRKLDKQGLAVTRTLLNWSFINRY